METNNFRTSTLWVAIIVIIAAFSSCTKNPVEPPPPQPANQELIVQFSNTGIALSTIDSIVAIVRDHDNTIRLWKTMDKGQGSFKLNLGQFAAGNYKAEVLAYSKKKADLTARQYAQLKEFQLPLQQPVVVNSPTGNFTDTWFQRAIFFDGPEAATIIVAMDPRDTYYETRFKQPTYTRIYLDRSSIDVNVLVAAKSTTRNIAGLIGFGEYGDFTPYVQRMQGKAWTKGIISGYIEQGGGSEIDFYYEYPNS